MASNFNSDSEYHDSISSEDNHGQEFLKEHNRLTAETGEFVSQTITDVLMAEMIAKKEMFDNRNAANSKWQEIQEDGRIEREANLVSTTSKLHDIDLEKTEFVKSQQVEIDRLADIHKQKLYDLSQESKKKEDIIEALMSHSLLQINESTKQYEELINQDLVQEISRGEMSIEAKRVDEQSKRNQMQRKFEAEMREMEEENRRHLERQRLEQERIKKEGEEKRKKQKFFGCSLPAWPYSQRDDRDDEIDERKWGSYNYKK